MEGFAVALLGCSLCPRLCSPSYGNVCTFAQHLLVPVQHYQDDHHCVKPSCSVAQAWTLIKHFMISLVQSWPLLVATSFRYPAKFTVCLAPKLTSPFHRVKFMSFPRESIQSVVSSTVPLCKKLSKGHASKIFGILSFSAGQVFGRFGRMYLVPFKLRQHGENGYLTEEIDVILLLVVCSASWPF